MVLYSHPWFRSSHHVGVDLWEYGHVSLFVCPWIRRQPCSSIRFDVLRSVCASQGIMRAMDQKTALSFPLA